MAHRRFDFICRHRRGARFRLELGFAIDGADNVPEKVSRVSGFSRCARFDLELSRAAHSLFFVFYRARARVDHDRCVLPVDLLRRQSPVCGTFILLPVTCCLRITLVFLRNSA